MRRRLLGLAVAIPVVLVAMHGCDNGPVTYGELPDAAVTPAPVGIGAACDDLHPCRPGLACQANKCVAAHTLAEGSACVVSDECLDGLYCGPLRTCTPAGTGEAGATCAGDGDCKSGLRCNLVGFSAECQPQGTGDVGAVCKVNGECLGGLACAGGACTPLPPSAIQPIAIPTWKGETCADDEGAAKPYFRVPRGDADDKDFFRFPFPSDIRRKAGKLDFTGFPSPGGELLGFDPVARYLRYAEQTASGFSPYGTVILRFSKELNTTSLSAPSALKWVDVTDGHEVAFTWVFDPNRSNYVCANSLSARPQLGHPLTPGHTFAFLVTNTAASKTGTALTAPAELAALLGATAPTGLDAAYATFKPLRDWAASKSFDLGSVVQATVFTVGTPATIADKLSEAVDAADVATSSGWIKCGGGKPSPCSDVSGTRACAAADPDFDELHALVKLPVFQRGKAPYLNPEDGGDFELAEGGLPKVQRTEDVCLALTVPKGTMPADGWPLVVYAHGTGGSFRSHVTEGIAKKLAKADDGAVPTAVLGIDQVAHGPRRGGSTSDPSKLYFNFSNPAAAVGNPLQGAADQMSVVRFARNFTLASADSPLESEVRFGNIAFWGHSQGATAGAVAMPYVKDVNGVVFSGVGGSLIDALLGKRNPVNIADVMPVVFVSPSVTDAHPALTILQTAIDPADPLNHAEALAVVPKTGLLGKHAFVPYGIGDSFSPPVTQRTYVIAGGFGEAVLGPSAASAPDNVVTVDRLPLPVSANLGTKVTLVTRQFASTSGDGHFVVFQDATASRDAILFLADLGAGKTPSVGR